MSASDTPAVLALVSTTRLKDRDKPYSWMTSTSLEISSAYRAKNPCLSRWRNEVLTTSDCLYGVQIVLQGIRPKDRIPNRGDWVRCPKIRLVALVLDKESTLLIGETII
jgi:hypothetical protein